MQKIVLIVNFESGKSPLSCTAEAFRCFPLFAASWRESKINQTKKYISSRCMLQNNEPAKREKDATEKNVIRKFNKFVDCSLSRSLTRPSTMTWSESIICHFMRNFIISFPKPFAITSVRFCMWFNLAALNNAYCYEKKKRVKEHKIALKDTTPI